GAHCLPHGPGRIATVPDSGRPRIVSGKWAVPGSAAFRPGSWVRRDSVNELEMLTRPPADLEVSSHDTAHPSRTAPPECSLGNARFMVNLLLSLGPCLGNTPLLLCLRLQY